MCLEPGLPQRRFAQIEDYIGPVFRKYVHDLGGFSPYACHRRVREDGRNVGGSGIQFEFSGGAADRTIGRRECMQDQNLQKLAISWHPGS